MGLARICPTGETADVVLLQAGMITSFVTHVL